MSDKSNKYGYVGVDIPAQSFGSNKGVFNPAEINDLVADNKWTSFGQLELIETKNVSASASAIFTDIKADIYNVHFMTVNNFDPSVDDRGLCIRFYENGVEESGTVYQVAYQYGIVTGTFGEDRVTNRTFLNGSFNAGTGTNEVSNSYNYFYNLGDSSKYSFQTMHNMNTNISTQGIFAFGSGVLPQASTVDQIKCFVTSGTFSGTISLYGIRYS